MSREKYSITLVTFIIISTLLLFACNTSAGTETDKGDSETASTESSPQTAPSEASTTTQEASAFIQGTAYTQAPPIPAMTIYALDPTTGMWASVEIEGSDAASSFSLEVPPGSYQVFSSIGLGYASKDGWSLGTVTVSAGQTVTGIEIRPPSQSECGSMFGIPASPDGKFAEIPGPSDECKATAMSTGTEGGLQPLDDNCTNLQVAVESTLQLPFSLSEVAIQNSISGQSGRGCQLIGLANGNNFENIFAIHDAVKGLLLEHGWSYGEMYLPCLGHGGAGPGADQSCFTRDGEVCEVLVYVEPVDMELCSDVEGPIGECLAILAPEDIIFTTMLTCARGLEGAELPEAEVTESEFLSQQFSIEFAAGATDTTINKSLQPNELHDYVFYAYAGQEMAVSLYVTTDGIETPAGAVMDIGVKGYAPTAVNVIEWSGTLPSTGEYYVDVKSMNDVPMDYSLYLQILPLEKPAAGETTGAISGGIYYPGQSVPPLHIVAFSQDTDHWQWVGTATNTYAYIITDLPPGNYHVIAYSKNDLVGAYASAGDGEPLIITVEEGKITEGIHINQWLDRENPLFPASSDPVGW